MMIRADKKITQETAREVGDAIGIDWDEVGLDEFTKGLKVEYREHGSRDPDTDVIDSDLEEAGQIAWAHLKEMSDYYARLSEMEQSASRRGLRALDRALDMLRRT